MKFVEVERTSPVCAHESVTRKVQVPSYTCGMCNKEESVGESRIRRDGVRATKILDAMLAVQ